MTRVFACMLLLNTAEDGCQFIRRLCFVDTLFDSPESEDEMDGAVLKYRFTGVRAEEHPYVHLIVWKLKTGRHDSDDRIVTIIEFDALAVDRLIRKMTLPESMTDNCDSSGA